jgi:hypothetical protein
MTEEQKTWQRHKSVTEDTEALPQGRNFHIEKKPKVAIVGCADSKDETPFGNAAEFEFWGVNNLYLTMPRPWTRWFDLHSFTNNNGQWSRRADADFRGQPVAKYMAGLQALNIPVYMQKSWALVPNSVVYPINEMITEFGDYFTNTISYMIAFAIVQGFEEIYVFGVDMAIDIEYRAQRPSCEYFIGIAQGRGIKVVVPDTCDLLKTRFLYGYHEIKETAFSQKLEKMGKSMIKRREKAMLQMEQAKKQAEFHMRQVHEYNGAIATKDEINMRWDNTVDMWPQDGKGGDSDES